MTFSSYRALFLALTVVAFGGTAFAQDNPTQLAALAREARTAGEHADVARRYRLQADTLDARAAEHEARAETLARNAPGIAHKWPSMAPQNVKLAKQQAVDARRAARESRELASRHQTLAVEALAAN